MGTILVLLACLILAFNDAMKSVGIAILLIVAILLSRGSLPGLGG